MRHDWMAGSAALCLALAACGDNELQRGEPYVPPSAAQQEREIFGETNLSELPASQRAALVYAHAVTAIALYRAGEADQAAVHAARVDASDQPGLMMGLDTMGFDPAALAAVAAAPGDKAAIARADTMLAALRPNATGSVRETARFLMKTLAAEYEAGADAGTIADLEAYQTAYGLAVAARDIVAAQEGEAYGDLRLELELLVRMWPGRGPLASSTPAPDAEMALALSNVKLALAGLP